MGKKKRGNYNKDYFKVGGTMQPGDDIVQEQQKQKLTQQKEDKPREAMEDEPAVPEDAD